jgi:hypothetical protein
MNHNPGFYADDISLVDSVRHVHAPSTIYAEAISPPK